MSKGTRQAGRPTKQDRRRDRREEQRRREEERLQATRKNRFVIIGTIVVLATIIGVLVYSGTRPTDPYANGSPTHSRVDNVICDLGGERTSYHVHAHLTIYMNGQKVEIPKNIGIPTDGTCLYWLHSHEVDGIIHVEAPEQQVFTLGTFLRIWGQEFTQLQYPVQLENADGWEVYVNGERYTGDFHAMELKAHTLITLAYQSPGIEPDTVYNWGNM